MSPEFTNALGTILGIAAAGIGAFIFAFWVSMGIWTFNDIRSRSRDWLAIALACLLVLVFPIIGLILYLMIRPKETLADIYDRALEEETLLRELEGSSACHQCGTPINDDWVYCPSCHVQLQHSCMNCNNLVRAEWGICVHCGTAQPGHSHVQSQPTAFQPSAFPEPQSGLTPLNELGEEDIPEVAVVQRRNTRSNPFMRPSRSE